MNKMRTTYLPFLIGIGLFSLLFYLLVKVVFYFIFEGTSDDPLTEGEHQIALGISLFMMVASVLLLIALPILIYSFFRGGLELFRARKQIGWARLTAFSMILVLWVCSHYDPDLLQVMFLGVNITNPVLLLSMIALGKHISNRLSDEQYMGHQIIDSLPAASLELKGSGSS